MPSPNNAEAIFTRLFLTPEGRANPYPLYHQLREAAPVHRSAQGMWLLSRYDDCWAALRDPRLGKDYARQIEQRFGADWRRHPSLTAGEHSMVNTTGPEHTRLRKLVSKSFTPRMIENLKPSIECIVNQLLDPVAEAGRGNVLSMPPACGQQQTRLGGPRRPPSDRRIVARHEEARPLRRHSPPDQAQLARGARGREDLRRTRLPLGLGV